MNIQNLYVCRGKLLNKKKICNFRTKREIKIVLSRVSSAPRSEFVTYILASNKWIFIVLHTPNKKIFQPFSIIIAVIYTCKRQYSIIVIKNRNKKKSICCITQ